VEIISEPAGRAFAHERGPDSGDAPGLGRAYIGKKIADLIRANTDASYTRELMKKEFAGTAALRQLLELERRMLLRVGAGMERGIWFRDGGLRRAAREGEIKSLLASAGLLPQARRRLRRHDGRAV